MKGKVYCIDFEASGLGTDSFPVEVALAGMDGGIRSWLIKPIQQWLEAGEWNKRSEAIHGLSLSIIETQGLTPQDIVAEMALMASDAIVLSDNVAHDQKWLQDLFAAANLPAFYLQDFHAYVKKVSSETGKRADMAIEAAKENACKKFPDMHRAGPDAGRNAEIIRELLLISW